VPVWHNHTGNQSSTVAELRRPGTVDELAALVREAEQRKLTVRAVGAGHAWSDVALTEGVVVDPARLSGLLELDDGTLRRQPADAPPLVRVRGGTHIHELNELLRAQRLALRNMGGYDAQTIAGVVSTSTHGSGLEFGPFPDMVHSLDLVIAGGGKIRVEPADGLTDPDAFRAAHAGDGWVLIQEDEPFYSAVCGMGTLGIIASLVLEVRERFWLEERRTVVGWETIRDTVTTSGLLERFEHYELFLNPYQNKDGTHHVLVTTREPCPEPADGESPGRGLQHPLTELEASLPITGVVLRFLARHLAWLIVQRFDHVLDTMQEPAGYRSISYKVFNIGAANHLPAYSMELGVTLEGDRHLQAVDRILAAAASWAKQGVYHTSPIALRFAAPSKAYASMMYDQPTMMIELIMVIDSHRGEELLASYERELADLDVRPHWGQVNALTAERVAALYPRWDAWLQSAARFNASGVFDSPFTRRVGIP
jgi:hypothetical protein